ncbi:hypothetical protein E2C01_046321 [Portunus trituberculatus]|uniref:Uncharacterized protein n=1 Tax=Portunus trituberculatus TaxID=210409 RepID=A0A5B7FY58_PORTR|nr:hypothetical protein [Portunus trituberculatus]
MYMKAMCGPLSHAVRSLQFHYRVTLSGGTQGVVDLFLKCQYVALKLPSGAALWVHVIPLKGVFRCRVALTQREECVMSAGLSMVLCAHLSGP